jgi:membrane protease YdiL (CAAX protease family)
MGKKQQKSKAIAFTFRPFLATFAIFHKWAKKQQKSKAIALTFRPFLATLAIFHKWAKNSKNVRLYP